MNTRTQNAKVIDYLATGRMLTSMNAIRRWGITRLAARINELRRNHDIDSVRLKRAGKVIHGYRLSA